MLSPFVPRQPFFGMFLNVLHLFLLPTILGVSASYDELNAIHNLHRESRCLCKCPDIKTVFAELRDYFGEFEQAHFRSIYVNSSIGPDLCNCLNVVIPHTNLSKDQAETFCPRCNCVFQERNLTIVKVFVILVIWVVSILVIYMCFLTCLEPLLNRRRSGIGYREQQDVLETSGPSIGQFPEETDDEVTGIRRDSTQMRTYGSSVMSRVGNQQTRWKQKVQQQRKHIYDTHSMLN